MSKRFKKNAIFSALILLIMIIAVIVSIPFWVSTELVRNAVEREMSNFSGRFVTVKGDVDLSLFPSPVIAMENIFVPSLDDNQKAILEVEYAEADISIWTLLSNTPNFTAFRLERPNLKLTQDDAGQLNWREVLGKISLAASQAERALSEQTENAPDEVKKDAVLLNERFKKDMGKISFSNGIVSIQSKDMTTEITAINGTIDWQQLDGDISAELDGIWHGQNVQFAFNAQKPLALLAKGESAVSINLSSDESLLRYEGILGLYDNLFADGRLAFSTPSMPSLLDWLKAEIMPGKAISALSIDSTFKVSNRKAVFENANLALGESTGAGVFEISMPDDEIPLLAGTMDFESLDLQQFLSAFVNVPINPFTSTETVDLSFTSQLRTDIRVSAALAQLGNMTLSNVAATAQISEKSAIFDLGDAEVYEGNLQGRLQFSNSSEAPSAMQFSMAGQNINTLKAAETLSLPATVPLGIANLSVNSVTPIGTWREMTRAASGDVSLKIAEGITRGFGINTLFKSGISNQFFTLADEENSDEQFQSFSFDGTLSDGIVSIKDAQIIYEDGSINLEGVAPYRSGGIALTAIAEKSSTDGDAEKKTFFIGGSWDRPFATPLLRGAKPLQ